MVRVIKMTVSPTARNTTANYLARAKLLNPPAGAPVFASPSVVQNGSGPFLNRSGKPVVLHNGPGRGIQLSSTHKLAPNRILSEGWIFLPDWQNCGGTSRRRHGTLLSLLCVSIGTERM